MYPKISYKPSGVCIGLCLYAWQKLAAFSSYPALNKTRVTRKRAALNKLILLTCVWVGTAFSAEKHHWEAAKVVSQDLSKELNGAYAIPLGSGGIAKPLYHHSNVIVLTNGKFIYTLSEHGKSFLIVTVNGEAHFYRDGDWFIMLDAHERKHKFSLIASQQIVR